MQVDLPEVVAEVRAEFERYEKALGTNDVDALDIFFRDDPRTIRYGVTRIYMGLRRSPRFARRACRSRSGANCRAP